MEEQTVTITVKTKGETCEMSDEAIREWYAARVKSLFDPAYGTPEVSVALVRKEIKP